MHERHRRSEKLKRSKVTKSRASWSELLLPARIRMYKSLAAINHRTVVCKRQRWKRVSFCSLLIEIAKN